VGDPDRPGVPADQAQAASVGNTGHGAERLASMLASPADWISPGRVDGFGDDPPAWNEKKVSLLDTDHIWGVGGNAAWVWKSFLRGHNPIFMDPYDGSVLGQDRGWEPLRAAMGHTRRFAERVNLAAMQPHDELASTGYCLANPGREYLVYQPKQGQAFSVELQAGDLPVRVVRSCQRRRAEDLLRKALEKLAHPGGSRRGIRWEVMIDKAICNQRFDFG
jgi:hypothetical protein